MSRPNLSTLGFRLTVAAIVVASVTGLHAQGERDSGSAGGSVWTAAQLRAMPGLRAAWIQRLRPIVLGQAPWAAWPRVRQFAIATGVRWLLPMWRAAPSTDSRAAEYEAWFFATSAAVLAAKPSTTGLADRVCAAGVELPSTYRAEFWARRSGLALARLDIAGALESLRAAKGAIEGVPADSRRRRAVEQSVRGVEQRLLIEAGRFDEAIERAAKAGRGQLDLIRLSKFAALEQWRQAERTLKRMLSAADLPPAWRGVLELTAIKIATRRGEANAGSRLRAFIDRELRRFDGSWRAQHPNGLLELAWIEAAYQACRAGDVGEAERCFSWVRPLFARTGPSGNVAALWATLRTSLVLDSPRGTAEPAELAAAARDVETVFVAWRQLTASEFSQPTALFQLGKRRDLIAARVRLRAAGWDGTGDRIPAGLARERAVFDALLDLDVFDSLVRRVGLERPEPDAVARALPGATEGGAVCWLPAPLASLAVTVRAQPSRAEFPLRLEVLRLPSDLRLWNDTQRIEELLRTPDAVREDEREWRRAVDRIRARMWPEALRETVGSWRQIAFIGRELAARLPAELLTAADGRPLALSAGVAYLPSITVGAWLADRRGRSVSEALVDVGLVAATRPGRAGLARLEVGGDLDRAIASVAGRVRSWRGAEATASGFGAAVAGRPRLLEVLGHGVFDDERAPPQGIALADADLWGAAFVEAVPPAVMLLSCSSGGGLLRRGDTVGNHLGGAALVGGADWVALSDVDLRLEPMLAQLEAFHAALPEVGNVPALALARARRKLVDRGRHLAEFVALRMEGLAYRPLRPLAPEARVRAATRWPWWAAVMGGIVLAIAAWGLVGRRRAARRA